MGGSLSRLKEQFANRFEPDGDGYMFRASLSSPGYWITSTARNRMLAEFNRRITWTTWGSALLIVVVFAAIAWLFISNNGDVPVWVIWAVLLIGSCPSVALTYWAWNAPARELRHLAPSADGRSKEDARRLGLQKLKWSQLALVPVLAVGLLWRVSRSSDLFIGWNRLWLAFACLLLLAASVQAVRKFLSDRQG